MEGTVFTGPEAEAGLAGAELLVYDSEGAQGAQVVADSAGRFSVEVPKGLGVHMAVQADEVVPTTFYGETGFQDAFFVADGELFGVSDAYLADWEGMFAGCPGLGDAGGVLFGEMRVLELTSSTTGVSPLVTTGFVWIEQGDTRIDACYLDDLMVYDSSADRTGESGRFAIFGIPDGAWEVGIAYNPYSGRAVVSGHQLWVQGTAVAPLLPAWVEFAFD